MAGTPLPARRMWDRLRTCSLGCGQAVGAWKLLLTASHRISDPGPEFPRNARREEAGRADWHMAVLSTPFQGTMSFQLTPVLCHVDGKIVFNRRWNLPADLIWINQ
jgi:hypothetical protein